MHPPHVQLFAVIRQRPKAVPVAKRYRQWRALNVSAIGKTITEAQRPSGGRRHRMAGRICRRDIGWQAVEREKGL
jgi:phosphoribosylamine-glycine ligase